MNTGADLLLICASFFGYAKAIASALERQGRRVLWCEDRPGTDAFTKGLVRVAPALLARKAEAYFDDIIEGARGYPIRDVLVIKGESLSVSAIQRMREAFPHARFVLYFWDSYLNMPKSSVEKVACFDRALTFDPLDAHSDTRLAYRPLWYLEEYTNLPKVNQDIDFLFFGTAHGDRYAVVQRLARSLPPGQRFEKIMYFPSRTLYRIRRVMNRSMWRARASEFVFEPLPRPELLRLIARSRVIVDIERPIQSGLTMRTIEMLGAGKKLVTTNPQVAKADFYDPQNIAVIDRVRPHVETAFLNSPYRPPASSILRRYSTTGWLEDVLDQTAG